MTSPQGGPAPAPGTADLLGTGTPPPPPPPPGVCPATAAAATAVILKEGSAASVPPLGVETADLLGDGGIHIHTAKEAVWDSRVILPASSPPAGRAADAAGAAAGRAAERPGRATGASVHDRH